MVPDKRFGSFNSKSMSTSDVTLKLKKRKKIMQKIKFNADMINLFEAGVTAKEYLFTLKVNKEIVFHFISLYPITKKKGDFGMFLG